MSTRPPTTTITTDRAHTVDADVLLIPVVSPRTVVAPLPPAAGKAMTDKLRKLNWKAPWGSAQIVPSHASIKAPLVIALGLGAKNLPAHKQEEGIRRAIGHACNLARIHAGQTIAVSLPEEHSASLAAAAAEAMHLAAYRFIEFKTNGKDDTRRDLRRCIVCTAKQSETEVRRAVREATDVLAGVHLARELVNRPAAHSSPAALVAAAQKIANANPNFTLKVLDRAQAKKAGFNAFLAVARGSNEEPYVIHLTYTPAAPSRRTVVLVGKGITFDSGGLSLKPASQMEQMKIDMGGAATVLGTASVLPKVKPDTTVHCIIAACENMPSGDAYRPGDILTAFNGKTIEVLNTDAEGRITLADALGYAAALKPDAIIDLATLTGAVIVALGETHAGLFSNHAGLRQALLASAKQAGEGLTSLPLPPEYRQLVQSTIADLRNTTANHPMGGAITAALFLKEFVGDTPWAHLDIAGPVYAEKQLLPYYTPGATGYGVRTLVRYLTSHSD